MRRVQGFTLLEMIVVMAIFAVLGLISSQIMSRVVDNFALLTERGERISSLHKAMGVIQRDVLQISNRGIRDILGTGKKPLLLSPEGSLEFTRLGWQNPLQRPRSQLQRVSYRQQDGALYRAYWLVLDQAPDSEPLLQKLIDDVDEVEFAVIDGAGNEHTFWPLDNNGSGVVRREPSAEALESGEVGSLTIALPIPPEQQMVAIVFRADIPPYGLIERIWMVPQWNESQL